MRDPLEMVRGGTNGSLRATIIQLEKRRGGGDATRLSSASVCSTTAATAAAW